LAARKRNDDGSADNQMQKAPRLYAAQQSKIDAFSESKSVSDVQQFLLRVAANAALALVSL